MQLPELFNKFDANLNWLKDNTLYLANHGSHAYGTNIETSDIDIRGICVAPKQFYIGCTSGFEQAKLDNPDTVIFELKKFFNLAINANPNILEILFVEPEDIIYVNKFGRKILDNKHLFLSKKIKNSMLGYSSSQLRKIQNGMERLKNPNHISERSSHRLEMEKEIGYDPKNAMHLVRLLRQCKETLLTGDLKVKRHDANELIEIRRGKWSFQQILNFADDAEKEIEEAWTNSPLPEIPNTKQINNLCIEIIEEVLF